MIYGTGLFLLVLVTAYSRPELDGSSISKKTATRHHPELHVDVTEPHVNYQLPCGSKKSVIMVVLIRSCLQMYHM